MSLLIRPVKEETIEPKGTPALAYLRLVKEKKCVHIKSVSEPNEPLDRNERPEELAARGKHKEP